MTQKEIDFDKPVRPADPNVLTSDVPRLSRLCQLVLDRLRQGPVTNTELYQHMMRPSGRVYDLKKAGHQIVTEHVGGSLWKYTLVN